MEHGNASTYTNHKCRCDACRAAHAEYRRAHPGWSMKGKTPPKHGVASAYTNYGCRCELCRQAWAKYHQSYVRRYRQKRHAGGQCIECAQPATRGLRCAMHAKIASQATTIRRLEKKVKEWTTL